MDLDALCAWLQHDPASQRLKLHALKTQHVDTIRALHDDDHIRVVREIKKRLSSPKLAGELAELLGQLAARAPNPRRGAEESITPPAAPASHAGAANAAGERDGEATRLEAAIGAEPTTRDSYIVYGDWLESRGDPRGQLVAIGQELAKNPSHKAMLAAHRDHLAAHAKAILGPLADCDDLVTEVEWFMGFIRSARVAFTSERFNLRRPKVAIEDVLGWLLDEPGPGRFLQSLTLGMILHDDNTYERAGAVIAKKPRPALRTLFLGDFTYEECELNWSHIGDVTALWPMVPNLRELTLRAGSMTLGPIDLPKLETMTTISGGLDAVSLAHVANAAWPALHTFSLQIGRTDEGAADDAGVLAPLLTGARVPKLRSLGIVNCEFVDELLVQLVASPLLAQLEKLDVSMGTMSLEGATTIRDHREKFAHVELNVDDNYLPAEAEQILAPCVRMLVFGGQRSERLAGVRQASAIE